MANEIARFNENNMDTLSVKKSVAGSIVNGGGPKSVISAAHSKQGSRSIMQHIGSRPGTSGGKAVLNANFVSKDGAI